ncbi:MAG: polyphenol oxidase family protein [Candidatus Dormibacteraceae bacterium]
MGLSREPNPEPVRAARRRFAAAVGLDFEAATLMGAVHGAELARVERPGGLVEGVDGLVTDREDLPLFAVFADCYPILLIDPGRRCLALAHAGWRGTRSGMATATVRTLQREYGCRPGDLVAGIGPGICGRCYEVGGEVASQFPPQVVRRSPDGRFRLDLAAANRLALLAAGLEPGNVHVQGACTFESAQLFSHRRDADGSRFGCLAALG